MSTQTKEKIDIIVYSDKLHKPLFDIYFYPSFYKYLNNSFNLLAIETDNSATDGSYGSSHWSDIIIQRFDIIKEYISKNLDKNKIAVFSDIDIVFFDNIYEDIIYGLPENIDICYMAENIFGPKFMINGGFFAFRCSTATLQFLDTVQRKTIDSSIKNDQPIIQQLLQNQKISYSIFNPSIFCTNNNPIPLTESLLLSCKVFHGTSATNIVEKCQVLSTIKIKKELMSNALSLNGKNLWIIE